MSRIVKVKGQFIRDVYRPGMVSNPSNPTQWINLDLVESANREQDSGFLFLHFAGGTYMLTGEDRARVEAMLDEMAGEGRRDG